MRAQPLLIRNAIFSVAASVVAWLLVAVALAATPGLLLVPGSAPIVMSRQALIALNLRGGVEWLLLGPCLVMGIMHLTGRRWRPWVRGAGVIVLAILSFMLAQRWPVRALPITSTAPSAPGSLRIVMLPGAAGSSVSSLEQAIAHGPARSTTRSSAGTCALLVLIALAGDARRRRGEQQAAVRSAQAHSSALEAQLSAARLDALRMQLQPHFLYNALNAVAGLIDVDPALAKQSVVRLGTLLRATLQETSDTVTLAAELAWLEDYLALQQLRFSDRLDVSIAPDGDTLGLRVPFLILQPLVENALQHGLQGGAGIHGGTIRIGARVRDGVLQLMVQDNGTGLQPPDGLRTGVGISNVRQRLAEMYGRQASLLVQSRQQGGAESVVSLPATSP
ncbi:MAG: signal transduction histidine kinase, LytS [Gemmatimonadetes bacterium]|nr:signal transduction histidine kinase, LytS [Gemmatimonadota bacterium]